jgi:hypothetical protein
MIWSLVVVPVGSVRVVEAVVPVFEAVTVPTTVIWSYPG